MALAAPREALLLAQVPHGGAARASPPPHRSMAPAMEEKMFLDLNNLDF